MKGVIRSNGSLVLTSEGETEEYAMAQWMSERVRYAILWTTVVGDGCTTLIGRLEGRPSPSSGSISIGYAIRSEGKEAG